MGGRTWRANSWNVAVDSESPTPQRLFFALWPEPELQERLYALGDEHGAHRGGRRIRRENLHLTLVFLGTVERDARTCLEAQADAIRVPRFEIGVDRIGCFRRRGLLWAGATSVPEGLRALVEALQAVQAACGFTPDSRAFQVHVTLVRNLRHCPREFAIAPIAWPVSAFALVASELLDRGARYKIVRRWELG